MSSPLLERISEELNDLVIPGHFQDLVEVERTRGNELVGIRGVLKIGKQNLSVEKPSVLGAEGDDSGAYLDAPVSTTKMVVQEAVRFAKVEDRLFDAGDRASPRGAASLGQNVCLSRC